MVLHEADLSQSARTRFEILGCNTDLGDYTYLLSYTHAHPNAFARPRGYVTCAFAAHIPAFASPRVRAVVC